uniref:IRF tryptophan pentad repeat domain-containing protein n=1 Tax=Ciona savignyi TaxID=51511 RepID=H2ZBR9_CIOSA
MTSPIHNGFHQQATSPHGYQHDVTLRHPGSPSSVTSSSSRGEPPKRLRHWLIEMIDSGTVPGLQWENPEMTIFRIPWKHAGKNNYKEEDCKIFKAWAEHRGKYKPGDKMDAATWKTRLRCALNKLPDIKELKDRSCLDGSEPYRVYQLLPEADKCHEFEIYPRSMWTKEVVTPPNDGHIHELGGYRMASPPEMTREHMTPPPVRMTSHPVAQEGIPQIDLTGSNIDPCQEFSRMRVQDSNTGTACYTINKLDIAPPTDNFDEVRKSVLRVRSISDETITSSTHNNDLRSRNASGVTSPSGSDVSVAMSNMDTFDAYRGISAYDNGVNHTMTPKVEPLPDVTPAAHEMELYIRYRRSNVLACHVTEPTGCRLSYGNTSLQLIASATHELPNSVFGPETLQQIELVNCEPYAASERQVQLTKHILNNLKRGLIIHYSNGCFYAKRLCQSRVFVYGPETTGSNPEKLERNASVKLFDYRKFCGNLRNSAGRARSAEAEVRISFAQSWSIRDPIERNLVNVCMIPRAAKFLLTKVREKYDATFSLPEDDSILNSGPDSYDRWADRATLESSQYVDELIQQMALSGTVGGFSEMEPDYQSGYFQQSTLQVAPPLATPDMDDVEMVGMI